MVLVNLKEHKKIYIKFWLRHYTIFILPRITLHPWCSKNPALDTISWLVFYSSEHGWCLVIFIIWYIWWSSSCGYPNLCLVLYCRIPKLHIWYSCTHLVQKIKKKLSLCKGKTKVKWRTKMESTAHWFNL